MTGRGKESQHYGPRKGARACPSNRGGKVPSAGTACHGEDWKSPTHRHQLLREARISWQYALKPRFHGRGSEGRRSLRPFSPARGLTSPSPPAFPRGLSPLDGSGRRGPRAAPPLRATRGPPGPVRGDGQPRARRSPRSPPGCGAAAAPVPPGERYPPASREGFFPAVRVIARREWHQDAG